MNSVSIENVKSHLEMQITENEKAAAIAIKASANDEFVRVWSDMAKVYRTLLAHFDEVLTRDEDMLINPMGFIADGDYYQAMTDDILVKILRKNYSRDSMMYARRAAMMYTALKFSMLDTIAAKLMDVYPKLSLSDIKTGLGDPYMEIFSKDWGKFVWSNHKFGDNIIICEFHNDMQLSDVDVSG